ncbi:iron-sulfur cluster-binding domain-containing protein [Kribbella sancticallisti]|uniref:flavin reductase family protein n=1 Tax=Kribbella sancticallisti TaxID=460087 RepID=UPI0031D97F53
MGASQYVFITGGIGVTPISSMVREARAAQRGTVVHYAGRSLSAMALREELNRYADRVHLYPRDAGKRMDIAAVLARVPKGVEIYCCGPADMVAGVEAAAAAVGIPQLVHVERFKPRDKKLSPPRPMRVEARRSQLTLEVPAELSLLTALERAGVAVASGCRNGLCGACAVPVLSGQVEHRDDVLTPQQHDTDDLMLTCVSRSASGEALVLDV